MRRLFLIIVIFFSGANAIDAQLLSFPGAEGAGKFVSGGRGNVSTAPKVFEVTSLVDNSSSANTPGTLRYAVTNNSPSVPNRIIVFRVSGTIRLYAQLNLNRANTTIAGQTAPGGGITISDYPVYISNNNIVIRYIRFRLGDKNQAAVLGNDDAFGDNGSPRQKIMIDHCTMSWSNDEVTSIYDGDSLSIQWCMMSEPLDYSYHDEGAGIQNHAYGGIQGGKHASLHHNIYAHCRGRMPRFNGIRTGYADTTDFRNNILYNWADYNTNGGEGGSYNVVNNYYKYGPNTPSTASNGVNRRNMLIQPYNQSSPAIAYGKYYLTGNYCFNSTSVTARNWLGASFGGGSYADSTNSKMLVPFNCVNINTQSATDAYQSVLKSAGCILPYRDTLDQRIVSNIINGTGKLIDCQGGYPRGTPFTTSVNAWPFLPTGFTPLDSDHDGMPDVWEAQRGLNQNTATDLNLYTSTTGYNNLETYLNGDTLTAPGILNTCVSAKPIFTNSQAIWAHLKDTAYGDYNSSLYQVSTDTNNLIASIYSNSNYQNVSASYYTSSTIRRTIAGKPFLSRNITITSSAAGPFAAPISFRIYISKKEYDDLRAVDNTISSLADLRIAKSTSTTCSSALPTTFTVIQPTATGVFGSYKNGYFIDFQTDDFGTFYIASNNALLPQAGIYYWIGGTSGNWTTPSNWSLTSGGSPASTFPVANDGVVFNTANTVTVNYDPASHDIGFASFTIQNNTQVTLVNNIAPAGTNRGFTINNGNASAYYEVVESGSSLKLLSNINTAHFSLGSDVLSSGRMLFNGPVYCINQALNTSYGPRLNATTDSMIINNLFIITSPDAVVQGSNPIGNKFHFGAQGIYQIDKNGGIYLFGKWDNGSLIKVTGSGSAFPVYWNGFYPNGYLLGGLEINTTNANSATITNLNIPSNIVFQNNVTIQNLGTSAGIQLASNPNFTVQGNLVVNNGNVAIANSSSNSSITINGQITNASGSTIDLQRGSANTSINVAGNVILAGGVTESGTATGSNIQLNGSVAQNLSISGNITNDVSLNINNALNVIALTDVSLSASANAILNLQNGHLNVLQNNKKVIVNNPNVLAISGGTVASHIIGALARNSNAATVYNFPVSDNAADLANASVTPSNTNATNWTVEFIRSNPNSATGLPAGIGSITPYRWDITRTGANPSDASLVNLKYTSITNNGITNPSTTSIVNWNNTAWLSLGGNFDNNGGINSVTTPITNFGSFSFGIPVVVAPTINATSLNAFGQICLNTVAGPNSFVLSGLNLTAGNITISSLSGFTYSLSAAGSYSSTLVIPQSGGTLATTTIYVQFTPTALQSYNGNIIISGGGASSINVSTSGSGTNQVTPTFTQINPICSGTSFTLPTTSTNGITGTWTPTINNTATTTYTFTPGSNQCATTTTMTVSVTPSIIPTFNQINPICAGGSFTLPTTSNNGITGVWTPAINNTATTTYTFTPTSNQCASTATMTVSVNPSINPTFNQVASICYGGSFTLPTTSNNNITGVWTPAINNTVTTTYTFTPDANQCANTTTMTVSVNSRFIPSFSLANSICTGDTFSLPAISNNNITGTWSPSINNTATTIYTFTPDANQCANSINLTVTVNNNCGLAVVYPNPTNNGNFNVNLKKFGISILSKNISLLMYNELGELVLSKKLTEEISSQNVSKLSNGTYFIKIVSADNSVIYTTKINKLN